MGAALKPLLKRLAVGSPAALPTLDLDFLAQTYKVSDGAGGMSSVAFADLITFARSSAAWRFNASGVLEQVAANQPRIDYDPVTLALRGLLVEEQRTNLYTNSENMLAYGSLNGGLARAESTFNMGLANFVDLIDNSNSDDFWYQNVATTANTILCASVSVKKTVGAPHFGAIGIAYGPTIIGRSVIFNPNTGVITATSAAGVMASGVIDQGTSWRVWIVVQMGADTTYAGMRCYPAWNTDGSITRNNATTGALTYGQPQIEVGSFPTSYIPTTSAQVTRAADVASVITLSPWFNPAEGTILVEAGAPGLPTALGAQSPYAVHFDNGGVSNRIGMDKDGSTESLGLVVTVGGSDVALLSAPAAGAKRTWAAAYSINSFAISVNGSQASVDTSGGVPSGLSRMVIGSIGTGRFWNGHIRRIRYWPRRLFDNELQRITA